MNDCQDTCQEILLGPSNRRRVLVFPDVRFAEFVFFFDRSVIPVKMEKRSVGSRSPVSCASMLEMSLLGINDGHRLRSGNAKILNRRQSHKKGRGSHIVAYESTFLFHAIDFNMFFVRAYSSVTCRHCDQLLCSRHKKYHAATTWHVYICVPTTVPGMLTHTDLLVYHSMAT